MTEKTEEQALEAILARYVERRMGGETAIDLEALARDTPSLLPALRGLVERYESLRGLFSHEGAPSPDEPPPEATPLPTFEGFRTIERLGRGGGGEVYRLLDLTLGRVVAGKVLRADGPLAALGPGILREARFLALFEDPRIVRVLDYRAGDPPLLLMEYVDGFELSTIGRSLEPRQKARLWRTWPTPSSAPTTSASSTAT